MLLPEHQNLGILNDKLKGSWVEYRFLKIKFYETRSEPGKYIGRRKEGSLEIGLHLQRGRTHIDGKKKGGLKVHSLAPMGGFVHLTEAACNDKVFLGQLDMESGGIYVFDKGYVNYRLWSEWTDRGVFYVTRLNDNAGYTVLFGQPNHVSEYADGGIVSDQIIALNPGQNALRGSFTKTGKIALNSTKTAEIPKF